MWTVRVVDANGVTTYIKRDMVRPLALSWARAICRGCKVIVLDTVREYRIVAKTAQPGQADQTQRASNLMAFWDRELQFAV